jgi:hypothetical protein
MKEYCNREIIVLEILVHLHPFSTPYKRRRNGFSYSALSETMKTKRKSLTQFLAYCVRCLWMRLGKKTAGRISGVMWSSGPAGIVAMEAIGDLHPYCCIGSTFCIIPPPLLLTFYKLASPTYRNEQSNSTELS